MVQALSLALAGSFYPVGLLFVLRYLATRRALFVSSLFLIGGALGCLAVAIAELVLLKSLPLNRKDDATPNGAIYVVLGAGLLVIAAIYAARTKRPVEVDADAAPPVDPGPAKAFFTGMIVYSPGLGLIAAIKALSDAEYSGATLVVGVILCSAIVLWMAEAPILATAISPRRSAPVLERAGAFVARHGRWISIGIAAALGAYLIGDGLSIIVSG